MDAAIASNTLPNLNMGGDLYVDMYTVSNNLTISKTFKTAAIPSITLRMSARQADD